MTEVESTTPRTVSFRKGDNRIIIWTDHKLWTVTEWVGGKGRMNLKYTEQLAMALSEALKAEGYEETVHD